MPAQYGPGQESPRGGGWGGLGGGAGGGECLNLFRKKVDGKSLAYRGGKRRASVFKIGGHEKMWR